MLNILLIFYEKKSLKIYENIIGFNILATLKIRKLTELQTSFLSLVIFCSPLRAFRSEFDAVPRKRGKEYNTVDAIKAMFCVALPQTTIGTRQNKRSLTRGYVDYVFERRKSSPSDTARLF